MEGTRVYTQFGKGTVVTTFQDGTVCVRLDSGGGVILFSWEIISGKSTQMSKRA